MLHITFQGITDFLDVHQLYEEKKSSTKQYYHKISVKQSSVLMRN